MSHRHRILFVVENVTLAQVVRLAWLGAQLPSAEYEVHFASSGFDPLVFSGLPFRQHAIHSLPKEQVFELMRRGKRLYERATLERYVKSDLLVIDSVRPDFIIGDFRLSLNVSAEVAGVPWAGLINAYWSPYAVREGFPVPDHPIVNLLGESLTARYFPRALPRVFSHFAQPVNAVRRRRGLAEVGSLLEVLTYGDYTLYPEEPWMVPTRGLPGSHAFLGPVLWEPAVPLPPLPADGRPLVYLTLGSSGDVDCMGAVVRALERMPLTVVVATAVRVGTRRWPSNFIVCDYVPGQQLARRAALVIGNGGSSTGYQALAAGTPLLGLPSNLDQFLTMQYLEKTGAVLQVKAREATELSVSQAVQRLLQEDAYRNAARAVAARLAPTDTAERFRTWLRGVLNASATTENTGVTHPEASPEPDRQTSMP